MFVSLQLQISIETAQDLLWIFSGWVPHEAEIGSFAYGGLFGVHRDKILQHSRYVYMNWMASAIANDLQAWVSERVYLILFGGPNFMDE